MVDGEAVSLGSSLIDLPVADLLGRGEEGSRAIFVKGEKYFAAFNRWIAGLDSSLRGVNDALTVRVCRPSGDGQSIYFGCSIKPDLTDYQNFELQQALENLPSGRNLHFFGVTNAIFLPISFNELDSGFAPSIVDDEAFIFRDLGIKNSDVGEVISGVVDAVTARAESLAEEACEQRGAAGREVAGVAAGVQGADDVDLAAAAIVARIEDLSGGDG